MEQLLIQLLGNSPTLIAVLLIYWRLDRRILLTEMAIKQLKNELNEVEEEKWIGKQKRQGGAKRITR